MVEDALNDRSRLRFADQVKTHFRFLNDHGFRLVSTSETLLRYESPVLAINIYHGRQSFEIDLELEFPKARATYSFSELLFLFNRDAERPRKFASSTPEGTAEGVRTLAALFKACVLADLLGDPRLPDRLEAQCQRRSREYDMAVQLEQVRAKLDRAWKRKDLTKVVNLLDPFEAHLSRTEREKLEYARRHI
jgi:hypothetical protein